MPPIPRPITLVALLTGVAICLSAIAVGGAALGMPWFVPGQRPAWMLLGFEVVIFVAGVLAVLFGRGRYGDGPGLALACLAGTVLFGSAFGWLSAGRQLGTMSLTPVLGVRAAMAGVLGAAGAYCVLSRHPRSWRVAALGVLLGAPSVALGAAMVVAPTRRAVLGFVSSGGVVQIAVTILGAIVVGGLLCASVHLIIKAFEMGRLDSDRICPACGYDWEGLAKCPECGRERVPGLAKA